MTGRVRRDGPSWGQVLLLCNIWLASAAPDVILLPMSSLHARPAPPGASLMRLSAGARLAGALAMSAVLWVAVFAVTQ